MQVEPEQRGQKGQPVTTQSGGAGWRARWQRMTSRLYDWWRPPSDHEHAYPSYSYRGHIRRNRLVRAWRRLGRKLSRFSSGVRHSTLSERLYNWWYPPSEHTSAYPGYSYGYGPSFRRSRPIRALHRLRRQLRKSAVGLGYAALRARLSAWWYPPSEHTSTYPNYSYYGYGSVQRNRLDRAWHRLKRRIWQSALGRRYRAFKVWWLNWWYPLDEHQRGYAGYAAEFRISRPVLLLRRLDRWLRQTWLGKKFEWLLDDLSEFLFFLRIQMREDFAWRRVRGWLLRWQTAALLVVLLTAASLAYVYGMPRFRLYREQKYAQQAQQFLTKGDVRRAMLRAQQVLSMNFSNAIATRVFADLAEGFGAPQALYWRQRAQLLMPSATNQIALASTALWAEEFPFPTATKTLNEVELRYQQTALYHRVAGALALKLAKLQEAEQHYTEALKLDPDSPVNRMSLAVVRLQSKDPKIITDSRTTLELLRTDRKLGLLATRSLVAESVDRREFERAETLSRQVLTNAHCSFSDRILHLAILNARHSTNFQAFLAETEEQAKEHFFHGGELAAWLNTFGHAQQALDWLKRLPPQFTQQGLLPVALADSYVALGKWKELEAYLQSGRWVGLDHVRFAMMTLAAVKLSVDTPYSVAWQSALRFASDSPGALNMLAKLTASWGWKERTEDVLWRAAQRYPEQSWPLTALNNFYASQRDTAGMRRVAQTAFQGNPKDNLAKNNYAMMSLLLGADVDKAHQFAAELHAADPRNPVFASTYSFSLFKRGRTPEALAILRELGLDQLDNPAVAAYYGIMLSASGDSQAARHYLDKASQAFLMPEELALVEQARKKR